MRIDPHMQGSPQPEGKSANLEQQACIHWNGPNGVVKRQGIRTEIMMRRIPWMPSPVIFFPLPLSIIAAWIATRRLSDHYIESQAYSAASAAADWRQLSTMFVAIFLVSYVAQFIIFTFGLLIIKLFPGD